jgi:predicted transcriptional regulator
MKKAIIRIRRDSPAVIEEMRARFVKAWKTGRSGGDALTFESPAALFRVLSPKRWELIETLQGLGRSSVRGLARTLDRDVKRVHEDVTALMEYGLVVRLDGGQVSVPYDVIHADFDLRSVA